MNRVCFLDLDGVLADFPRAAIRAHGCDPDSIYRVGSPGPMHIHEALEMSAEEFWAPLNKAEFWEEIPPTPEAADIARFAREYYEDEVYIASSPSLDPTCMVGKVRWIERHFPKLRRRWFMTPNKHLLAKPGAMLIDDFDSNCDKFRDLGGRCFLVARPWNSMHRAEPRIVNDLVFLLETMKKMGW